MVRQKQDLNEASPAARGRFRTQLILSAIVLQVSYVLLALVSNWNSNIPIFLTIYFLALGAYSLCVLRLLHGGGSDITAPWILLPAVLFRLTVFWCEPTLSEDFYRYRWDGKVQMAGKSPYAFPPRAPELETLRDSYDERINHKEFRTPYAAAAESFYHLFASISTTPLIFKSFLVLFDLFILEILRRLLKKETRNVAWLLIYAWHPLTVVEFAGGAHMDSMGLAFLLLSYLLLLHHRSAISGAAYAVGVLTKYLPILMFPWFVTKGKWKWITAGAITGAVLLLQYYSPDMNMFSGFSVYYRKWRFNDSLFGILYSWLGGAEPARITGGLITLLVIGICLAKKLNFYRSAVVIFGTVIVFSPVVHPWYLCWLLPFLVFHPNKPWLFLCGWVPLAYLIRHLYPVGVWKPVLWLKLLIYVPFYLYLLWDSRRQIHTTLTRGLEIVGRAFTRSRITNRGLQ